MTAQQARQSVVAWMTTIPKLKEGARALGWFVVIFASGIAGFVRFYQLPARVDATEARVGALEAAGAKQDSAIAANRRGVDVLGSQMELQTCDRLARAHANRKTPDECVSDYLERVRSQP